MRNHTARSRAGLSNPSVSSDRRDTRIWVDVAHLRQFEGKSRALRFLPRQPARSVLNGRHASRLRGRGLNFEELRGYLPGDDVRAIDWKVTARTGEPHIRVYSEERDRPALIVVDQRMSMFFGTTLNMKSVTASEVAALAAWRVLDQGDRVGGLVFTDDAIAEVRPQRSRAAVDRLLHLIVQANQSLNADRIAEDPLSLNRVLEMAGRIASRDHLVIIVSDFDVVDDRTEILLGGMARHNDIILVNVSDPVAQQISENASLIVSDGQLQAEIDTGSKSTREALSNLAKGRLQQILSWQTKLGLSIIPISSGEATEPQLRRLLGLSGGTR